MDAHANFAISAVATAPSPATSGTSLVVTSGHGARFPATPFNATIWPQGSLPDPLNAEIVRVTAISTDTLTITRAQEGTTARTVVVGDLIAATITKKTLNDAEFWDDRIVKPSDEIVNNSTALQDDNDLQFAVVGGVAYLFRMVLIYDSPSNADFKHAFALSTGSFTRGQRIHTGWGSTTVAAQHALVADMTTAVTQGASITEHLVSIVEGSFQVSTNATIKLQWAQNSLVASDTTLKAGSLIEWRKLT